ncbi:MAG: peroxiredoxin [Bacteroidetes bacterium QS_8_64_10]|nr:MAG: peroxiredoxin [Bacteroidetes bacterium QS_8_64_10]
MPTRTSEATWNGDLESGNGSMTVGDGAYEGPFSFESRFEDGQGTNPEELIAAAHAGCYSMALSNMLADAGHAPESVHTTAEVHLEMGKDGPGISNIDLTTEADVPDLSEQDFQETARKAKENCPVSQVLAGAEISLNARLKSSATV